MCQNMTLPCEPNQARNSSKEPSLKYSTVKVGNKPDPLYKQKSRIRWQNYKSWIFTRLKKMVELAVAYGEAKVEMEKSEARKIAEKAAEIAARKDLTELKQIKEFNSIIDDIFADDNLPPNAKALKLAKLMEKNPEIVAQLRNIKEVNGFL